MQTRSGEWGDHHVTLQAAADLYFAVKIFILCYIEILPEACDGVFGPGALQLHISGRRGIGKLQVNPTIAYLQCRAHMKSNSINCFRSFYVFCVSLAYVSHHVVGTALGTVHCCWYVSRVDYIICVPPLLQQGLNMYMHVDKSNALLSDI